MSDPGRVSDPLLQRAQALGLATPTQAQEILQLAQQHGVPTATILQRRLSPQLWARLTSATAPVGFGFSPGPAPQTQPTTPPPAQPQLAPPDEAPTFAESSLPYRPRAAPGVGQGRVGDFELVRELARGGMGVVYVARSPGLDRQVALKLLLEESCTAQGFERFRTEARTAARLKHPNIVGIHHVGEEEGNPYLVMDLIQGESLDEVVRERGPLPTAEAAQITHDLAGALAYAHQLAVLHRDLKPHNVILSEDGTPILTDFGLAKDVGEAEGLTVTGQVLGTPAYMPPEQASGELESIDRRADVYGLGATLYHLLTGVAPFGGETYEILTAVLMKEAAPPSSRRPGIDRDLDTICLKCLEKDPSDRYRTMGELKADLRAYLDDQPIAARPPSLGERLLKWRRRNPTLAKVLLAASLIFLCGGLFAALRIQSVGRGAALAEQARLIEAAAQGARQARAALDQRPLPDRGASKRDEELEARGAAALQAFVTAERWHSLAPGDTEAARAVFLAACDLGQVNEGSRQWLLAIQAYEAAATLPVDPEAARVHAQRVRAARDREREQARASRAARREAVEGALAQATQGQLASLDFAFERATFRIVRNLDAANLELLCGRLEAISSELTRAEAALWERALGAEARAVLAILPRRAAGNWSRDDEKTWQSAARILERWHRNETGNSARGTTIVGSEQTRALGQSRVAEARLIVAALGQSEAPSGRAALIGYLRAEQDAARATLAGRALCLGEGSDEVGPVIRQAIRHFGPRSPFSSEVVKVLGQVEELAQDVARDMRERGHDPEDPARLAERVSVLQRQGKLQEALALANRSLSKGEAPRLLVERSIVLRTLGRAQEAFADAQRACELAPRSAPAKLARLFCLRDLKRHEEGLAQAEAILAENWRVPLAHLLKAGFLHSLGRREAAIKAFGDTIRLDPEEVEAYTNRALLYFVESREVPEGRRQELLAAAEADLASAERLAPTNVQAISIRADLALARGQGEQAISLLDQAIDRQPRNGYLWLQRARAKHRAGDRAGAKRDAAHALGLGEPKAKELVGALAGEAGDERFTPEEVYQGGRRALAEGRPEEAERAARTLQQGATDAFQGLGHTLQAMIFIQRRRYRKAIAEAKRAATILPKHPEPYHQAGLAFYFLGDLESSVRAYTRAHQLGPEVAVVLTNRASTYMAGLKRHQEWADLALADLEATLKLDPNQAPAWGNLGFLKAQRGDRAGAIQALERSVELAPKHPMAAKTRQLIEQLKAGR